MINSKLKFFYLFITAILISTVFFSQPSFAIRLYDLDGKEKISLSQVVDDLKEKRIVLIGEIHSHKGHHQAQMAIIKALTEAGLKLAIGLEMFSRESQEALNNWVNGKLDLEGFKEIYYDNWNLPWHLYGTIFEFARKREIPLIGLNVPRRITSKVAHRGFDSLTETEKGKLSDVTCIVDPEYKEYIRNVHRAHGHGGFDFTHFCEAQLVWDKVMAIHALEYLRANPGTVMVILTGNGHARKMGIPKQIRKRSDFSYAVILPRVPGYITVDSVSFSDADYIIYGFGSE